MIPRCSHSITLTILLIVVCCLTGCGVAKPSIDAVPAKVVVADKTDYAPLIRQATWDAYEKVLQEVTASQFPVDPVMAQARIKGKEASYLILDLRAPEVYAQKHVHGAVNMSIVALAENIASLPKDKTLLLYCYTGQSSALAMVPLKAYGFQAIFINGGFAQMEKAGFAMDNTLVSFVPTKNDKPTDPRQSAILKGIQANLLAIARQHTVKTLVIADQDVQELTIGSPQKYAFVDLRPTTDFAKGHIKGAISAPLAELRTRVTMLPKDKRLVLCCKSGQLAAMSTAPLTAEGFKIISLCAGLSQADKGPLPWEALQQ